MAEKKAIHKFKAGDVFDERYIRETNGFRWFR